MTKSEMLQRTKRFALRVIKAVQALPKRDDVAAVLGRQLLRSGTSVGANYRATCRAKSTADFINKADELLSITVAALRTTRANRVTQS